MIGSPFIGPSWKHYLLASSLLLAADVLFITFGASGVYKTMIREIQGKEMQVNFYYCVACYALMLVALNYFTIRQISADRIITTSISNGAVMGCIVYGVYAFTSAALFTDWKLKAVLLDISWGIILYTIVPILTFYILKPQPSTQHTASTLIDS